MPNIKQPQRAPISFIISPLFSQRSCTQGSYSESNLALTVPDVPLPSWMVRGKYSVKVDLEGDGGGGRVGCLQLDVRLK